MISGISADRRERILTLAKQHGVTNVRIFGSVARGEANDASDLDLIVDVDPDRTLLSLIAFWQAVEEDLGQRVDVVTEGGISPHLRDRICAEAVPL